MNWRGRRGRRIDSGMPQVTSEKKVREGWYADRLRRLRIAAEEALGKIDAVELTEEGSKTDADSLLRVLGEVASTLRLAINAEKYDAGR